jgi:L-aspartate semialdehyde sulfurtransferase
MARARSASEAWPQRSLAELQQRQASGALKVATASAYRQLVGARGLEHAFRHTDVVVAAEAHFTDQGALLLALGPSEPPIRLRELQLAGVAALVGGSAADLVLPLAAGGAQVLTALLAGEALPLSALGEGTALQPRLELSGSLSLAQVGSARLLLHRAVVENGIVAVSSAEGLLRTPHGPLLGPLATALSTCGGAGSIGLTMPGLALLGPGSPLLVGGALGWVVGAGSGHNPSARRLPSGHAAVPGASLAVAVELEHLPAGGLRSCRFEGYGSALLVPIAAPVPLLNAAVARQAAASAAELQAPVLDLAIPRRVKPCLASVSYADLEQGTLQLQGRSLSCAPAHSPRLAAAAAEHLAQLLRQGHFPLQLPLRPLSSRSGLRPLDL